MQRITIILISSLLLTAVQPAPATAENKFIKSFNDLFKKTDKQPKNARPRDTRIADTQSYLNALGFDAGKSDGLTGRKTRRAISAYQQAKGYPETGTLRDAEFTTLKQQAAPLLENNPIDPALAQSQLKELGFFEGEPDGIWGSDSQNALDNFRNFTALRTGTPLNPKDMKTLGGTLGAIALLDPETDEVFDTITIFGNSYALSEPDLSDGSMTWPTMTQHIRTALPQSQALQLDHDAALKLIDAKLVDLSAAYQAQIDMLFILMQPQIRTYVETNNTTDIDATIARYDTKIAEYLIAGKGDEMIKQFNLTTPGIDEVISLTQATTRQMQSLQLLKDNMQKVTNSSL